MEPSQAAFVVGFPGFLATRLVERLLAGPEPSRVFLLVDELCARQLEELMATLTPAQQTRLSPLYGRTGPLDLGLAGAEVRQLTERVTHCWYLPDRPWPYREQPVDPPTRPTGQLLEGVRELLTIAREARQLERICLFSSAFVAGTRTGVVLEEELGCGQIYRDPWEALLGRAEQEVARVAAELPVMIFRPTLAVVDSRTGACDPDSGATAWLELLACAPGAPTLRLTEGNQPCPLVPVDHVLDLALRLSQHPQAVRRTFHLTDPRPLSFRHVAELVTSRALGKTGSSRLAQRVTAALLELPSFRDLVPAAAALDRFQLPVHFRMANLAALLPDAVGQCPPFESYLDLLVEQLRLTHRERGPARPGHGEPGWLRRLLVRLPLVR